MQGAAATLARWCGVPKDELVYWAAGINHQAWYLTLRHGGKDLYPTLQQAVLKPGVVAEERSRIINALKTGAPVEVNANVANEGLITNLPAGSCVEVPCLASGDGVHPYHVGALPPQLTALDRASIPPQEPAFLAHKEADPERVVGQGRRRSWTS